MSEWPFFLDVNVPMYAAGKDHPYKEPCTWVLKEVAEKRLPVVVDTEIIQEILYRYGELQRWDVALPMARSLLELVTAVYSVTEEEMLRVMELFERYARQGVKARDLIHVAVMESHDVTEIISTDKHFDQIPDITRLDPREMFEDQQPFT